MEFMKDNTTGSIKQRISGEKLKLIAEVRKRPELWCIKSKEYMPRLALQKIWEDLAQAMGADVDDCKRKWYLLRLAQRTVVKRLELRIKQHKLKGSYNPNNEYRCKWFFYEHMKFCDDIKNPSPMKVGNTSVNDNNSDDNDSTQVCKFLNNKMEPELDLEPEVYLPDDEDYSPQTPVDMKSNFSGQNSQENQGPTDDKPTTSHWKRAKRSYDQANCLQDHEKEEYNIIKSAQMELGLDLDPEVCIPDDEEYDTDSQMSDVEFLSEQNSPSNQQSADDKPSSAGVLSPKVEPELDLDPEVYIPYDEDDDTDSQMSGMEFLSEPNSPQNQESADDKPSSVGGNCTKRPYDQANCLEDLEKDANDMVHVADSDYNFLVSFLPKIKKINEFLKTTENVLTLVL